MRCGKRRFFLLYRILRKGSWAVANKENFASSFEGKFALSCFLFHIYICGDIYIYVQVICFIYRSQGLFLINFFKPTSPTKNPLGETVVHETPAVIVERSPLVSPSCGGPPRSIPRDGASSTPALRSPRPWPSRPPEDKKKRKEND